MSDDIKRDRSPNYPKMPLSQAIEMVSGLYKKAGKSQIRPEVAVAALGYGGLNGAALTTIGALSQYGLLDRVRGEGIAVSQLAIRLMHPVNQAQDMAGRREAALKPKVFSDLFSGGFHVCDEDVLGNHLMQEGFTHDGAKKAASVFKANVDFAKLQTETIQRETENDTTATQPEPEIATSEQPANKQAKPAPVFSPAQSSQMKEFTFPLPSGAASIRLPMPFGEGDYQALIATLGIFKQGLVETKPDPVVVSTTNNDWEVVAEQLVKEGHEFELHGFNYSHDLAFYTRICKEYNVNGRFNPQKGIAYFSPKS